jgi:Fe-S-cluster containining protein
MSRDRRPAGGDLPPLNGLSIDSMTINQDGDLKVVFDLPAPQTSACFRQDLQAQRTIDVYEHPRIRALCRDLFRAVREVVLEPDPERVKVSCDRCGTSSCCRKYNVLVTDRDTERLAAALGVAHAEFLSRYAAPAVDWCEDYAHQLVCDEDDDGEKCVFLKPNEQGQMRCSVYEHRPEICRAFDVDTCEDFVPLEDIGIF